MKTYAGPKFLLCCLLTAGYVAPAHAQFKRQQSFEGTTAPGWTLSDSAILTAPSIDATGSGWLRLTAAVISDKGLVLNSGFNFASNQPVVLRFNYVSWGGTGADGMTVFLYDSSTALPMAGASTGGALGYCRGAGGYMAIGLDEFGDFSNPGYDCAIAGGGPGRTPESLVIRGPESSSNAWVSATAISGGVDSPLAVSRPAAKTVQVTLTPVVAPAVGYTITAQFRSAAGETFQTLFSEPFPYAPPANLGVGISGATGGFTNSHELQGLTVATPDDLQVTMTGPISIFTGSPAVTYLLTVTNNGDYLLKMSNAPTVVDTLPAPITGATWTCVGGGGAACGASGTGSIDTTNVTLPAHGSVTYTITGTLDPGTTCGSSVANTADADFGTGTTFLDPDETNNTATVNSTVICDSTLANNNPASLTYAPQQVGTASTSQAVTVTEGGNGSAAITSIAVTGDYSQTNNCPATLAIAQTCTVNVVFTPSAVGIRTGTLTIQSDLANLPAVTSVVSLTGTGINSVPGPFSFTPIINVPPSSVQVCNAITVAGTDVPAPIGVSAGGQYSINGGAFTSGAGVVSPGAQVTVRLTAASGYSTSDSAVLTIGGVSSTFTITTGVQPLQHVATTGGGGAIGGMTLLMLALLATLKAAGARRSARLVCLAVAILAAISSNPARADDADWLSNFYGGLRVGESTSSMTAGKLARDLRADGFQITDAGAERGTFGGGLYLGYELPNHFAVEIAGTYIGRTRAALGGVLPSELGPLLADTAHIVRGSGDIVALEARYRLPLMRGIDLDLRAGPYFWLTTADVYVSGVDKLNRSDNGLGYTLGVGPRFALGQHVGIGVSAEYFNSTSQNQFWQFSATLEYHFR